MKYLLKNIEIWSYDGTNFPTLIDHKELNSRYSNQEYTTKDFTKIEKEMSALLGKKGFTIHAIMNPLYGFQNMTVISIDVSKSNIPQKGTRKNNLPQRTSKTTLVMIKKYLKQREKRLGQIFKTGKGSLKRSRKNGILFSEDKTLLEIEIALVEIAEKNRDHILSDLEIQTSTELINISQWLKKDKRLLTIYFHLLIHGNEQEKNDILLSLIPLISHSKSLQKKITPIIINHLLIFPTSSIRNKALSILCDIPKENIIVKNGLVQFIDLISKTDQLNCSYPANEIKKAFGIG